MQFASEKIERARLHCAEQIQQAARLVVDELLTKCDKQIELVKQEYTNQIEHVELMAIRELLQAAPRSKYFPARYPMTVAIPTRACVSQPWSCRRRPSNRSEIGL